MKLHVKRYFQDFQNFSGNGAGDKRKILIFIKFSEFQNFLKITRKGWKLRKITLFYKNNTFEKTKSCFQEFRNFCQNGLPRWFTKKKSSFSLIFQNFKMFFKITGYGWKPSEITLFYENSKFNLYNHIFKNFKISVKIKIAYQDGLRKESRHFHQISKISEFFSNYLKMVENSVKLPIFYKNNTYDM